MQNHHWLISKPSEHHWIDFCQTTKKRHHFQSNFRSWNPTKFKNNRYVIWVQIRIYKSFQFISLEKQNMEGERISSWNVKKLFSFQMSLVIILMSTFPTCRVIDYGFNCVSKCYIIQAFGRVENNILITSLSVCDWLAYSK